MKAVIGRHLTLGTTSPPSLPNGEDYVVRELRCPRCGGLLGWRESVGQVQLPAFPQSPDGSTFYRLPHTIAKCPHCPAGPVTFD